MCGCQYVGVEVCICVCVCVCYACASVNRYDWISVYAVYMKGSCLCGCGYLHGCICLVFVNASLYFCV